MRRVVPDASVLLKWVLPPDNEAHVVQALDLQAAILREEVSAALPALWYYEVGNTLARRFHADAGRILTVLRDFALEEWGPGDALQQVALDLATQHGVTFYDASYHALAIVLDGTFITSDTRYLERTQTAGHIAHLMDWPLAGGGKPAG